MLNFLVEFIDHERIRFTTRSNNMFATSFSEINRYYTYLEIISMRLDQKGKEYINSLHSFSLVMQESKSGTMSNVEMEYLRTQGLLGIYTTLEIESFYIFAKILLDKIARAIEFYFGPQRGMPLDSHDDLSKRIVDYCQHKELNVSSDMLTSINILKKDISDFRDQYIAHEKSPRTLRAHTWNYNGDINLMIMKLYPKENEHQIQTKPVSELLRDIYNYIETAINFVKRNSLRTSLKLVVQR